MDTLSFEVLLATALLAALVVWMATNPLRKARPKLFNHLLLGSVAGCAICVLVGTKVSAPDPFLDWVTGFGFGLSGFAMAGKLRSYWQE
jgi:hypothetical protein